MENTIFNFGTIFDSIRDSILFLSSSDRGKFTIPYDAGYGIGNAIYFMFKN